MYMDCDIVMATDDHAIERKKCVFWSFLQIWQGYNHNDPLMALNDLQSIFNMFRLT